jgi:hypothetical protein
VGEEAHTGSGAMETDRADTLRALTTCFDCNIGAAGKNLRIVDHFGPKA